MKRLYKLDDSRSFSPRMWIDDKDIYLWQLDGWELDLLLGDVPDWAQKLHLGSLWVKLQEWGLIPL